MAVPDHRCILLKQKELNEYHSVVVRIDPRSRYTLFLRGTHRA
jgi:hypothetical protein